MKFCKYCNKPIDDESVWNPDKNGNGYHHSCLCELEFRTRDKQIYDKGRTDALEQIRAEIKTKYDSIPWRDNDYNDGWVEALEWVYDDVIGKYAEQEPTDKSNLEKICEELAAENDDLRDQLAMRDRFKQEPCDDVVSRQAVINLVRGRNSALEEPRIFNSHNSGVVFEHYINDLPPVRPQEPTGHWIIEDMFDGDVAYRCSECNELFWLESGTPKDNEYNFCPKCGKKLVEPQESEDKE